MTKREVRRIGRSRFRRSLSKGTGGPGRKPRVISWRYRRLAARVAAYAMALSLLGVSGWYSAAWVGSDSTCLGCHAEFESRLSPHEAMACDGCHRPAGLLGAFRHGVQISGMTFAAHALDREHEPAGARPEPSACLRCHGYVLDSDFDDGRSVRVNHRHLIEAGFRCDRCHDSAGHRGPVADRPRAVMERCMGCHDGEEATARCEGCHNGRPSDSVSGWRRHEPVVSGMGGTCAGCHSPVMASECIACHGGYEMPHPAGWGFEGGHMYDALTDQESCEFCHAPARGVDPAPHGASQAKYGGAFCNNCHHTYPSPHGDARTWLRAHGPVSRGAAISQPSCTPCHATEGFISQCTVCHNEQGCQSCHAERDRRRSRNSVE